MNLDDLLALAASDAPTRLETARARRAARRIRLDRDRRLAEGPGIDSDVDLHDPATTEVGEAARITRAAELTKRGSITWTTAGRRLKWSGEMLRIFGRTPAEAPRSPARFFALIHPADRAAVRRLVLGAWRAEAPADVACRLLLRDGSVAYAEFLVEVVTGADGRPTGIVATGEDVTAARERRREDDRRALRDGSVQPLTGVDATTGLLSRRAFADEVGRALRAGTGTLLVISAPPLARPAAGDDRLSACVARVLRDVVGCDPCGVLGPDEFGVLMPYTTFETATPTAEQAVAALRETRFLAGRTRLDAFGGLVRYDYRLPTEGLDLLLDAETAWRRAKHEDRPLHVLRQAPAAAERREICRTGIRTAVAGNRFTLFAQPLRDLELNRVTRHEILLRVFDDVGRPTAPTAFLEVAEHVDEILSVDKWVIDQALRLIGEGSQTSHYQINISGRSLADPLLLDHIRGAVERFRVDPEHLTIEITETAAIGNLVVARRFADGLRELGCQLALDDFGTGNTPLGFLTGLPVDLVKIDGSFIRDLPGSPALQVVVRGLVEMCRSLGIRTAAEYVEDATTLDLLRAYGVDFAQGFHVGAPKELVAVPRRTKSVELELIALDERVV
jgi:PAS domain S-box-containing protein